MLDWAIALLLERSQTFFGETRLVNKQGPYWQVWLGDRAPSFRVPPDLGSDGFVLEGIKGGGVGIAANTAEGLSYGVFALMKEWGCGYFFGGDAIPRIPWRTDFPEGWRREVKPRLSIRGLQPFHNFINGPTCWTLEDYKAYFDSMAAQGLNMALFHSFNYEPHGAYPVRENWYPSSVKRSHARLGGRESVDLETIPGWARKHFDGTKFGPPDVLETLTVPECIEKAQSLLASAFSHARDRGIKTCAGFEIHGDPRSPEIRRLFLRRLDHFIERYQPSHLALWQQETVAGRGWHLPVEGTAWEKDWSRHRKELKRLGAPRRGLEVLRLAEFLNLAHQHLRKKSCAPRLVLSGWGGDKWMCLPETFEFLDKMTPPDIVFSALDNLDANISTTVSSGYRNLPATRERWPIVWLEGDAMLHASQWHPAANVGNLATLTKDAIQKGCHGALGIHWRFSHELEGEVARFANSCWREETDDGFWRDYAARCYGARAGKPLAKLLAALDQLGAGWSGFSPQTECCPFSWESIPEILLQEEDREDWKQLLDVAWKVRPQIIRNATASYKPLSQLDAFLFLAEWTQGIGADPSSNLRKLEEIRRKIARVREAQNHEMLPHNGARRLGDLCSWLDFVIGYDRIARLMRPGGKVDSLCSEAELHVSLDAPEHAAKLARKALLILDANPCDRVLQGYAESVRSTSQRGNLVRMCEGALSASNAMRDRLLQIAEKK